MSHLLDNLLFFRKNVDSFADGHGVVTREDRTWEDAYRNRWDYDKIVRSTHGVNCTGSCSWNVFVKNGIVTWEMQATDYPRTRPDLPNHEPRGCPRGAAASWYMYSGNRIKYPLVRRRLLELWREARRELDPVSAWRSIAADPARAAEYKRVRGRGGFVRARWNEVNELIAAATAHTIREHGPDRLVGFTPIPAFSMASFAAGTRFISLLGGTCLSFYDWYADLPPSSPMTWGEQTDVPESATWYDAAFLLLWGSNVPQTRTPDAHFYTEARYRGARSVVIAPDYNEAAKFADLWVHPRPRTDSALAMAMGHVILNEFHAQRQVPYFTDYIQRFTDLPLLVKLRKQGDALVADRFLRAADFADDLGQTNKPEWKTVAFDDTTGEPVVPHGSIGFRYDEPGRWNLEQKDARDDRDIALRTSVLDRRDDVKELELPYFGDGEDDPPRALKRRVPVRRLSLPDGETFVTTVLDLLYANYGIDRGLEDPNVASSYDDASAPYTPAWQERLTGVPREQVIEVAREFASSAEKTDGRCTVIIGCGVNQAYHTDATYRAVINMLILCGCVGREGGGWAHYVGQEKVRPFTGWATLAFALDWLRPPRQMNTTSYFYAHTDQFRYETVSPRELISPTESDDAWDASLIDLNVRAERMGWLPSSPQLTTNPLEVARQAAAADVPAPRFVAEGLANGSLQMACEDPDDPRNFPRVMFIWRANLLGASGKGHEYFLRHLLGARNGVDAPDLGERGDEKPRDVVWHDTPPEGKMDLLVTLDFRMSSTCIYSDVVLPSATWYEKHDLSSTDMHPFLHPLSAAVDPGWEARTDWDIFKGLAKSFSEVAPEVLGVEHDVVLSPIQHDTPAEPAQPFGGTDWKREGVIPEPGKTMPGVAVVERDYPRVYEHFTSLGPKVEEPGIGAKGISWSATREVEALRIRWSANWEDDLGGAFVDRSQDANMEGVEKDLLGQFESTFMMYLPRLCEHCLNPTCVAACPSGSIYKREEDGIVLIDQDKCRGWRMCMSGCPYKKIYYNWRSGKAEKCTFCYPRIEAGLATVCSETCVGRIRYLGVMLYDADRIESAAAVRDEQDLHQAQLDIFLDPSDPEVQEAAHQAGVPHEWVVSAQRSPVYKLAVEWKLAFPLHPEYRTLPMVWYCPPLSPIQAAAQAGQIRLDGELPDVRSLRIPLRYLANLLSAGDEDAVARALERMAAMRVFMRSRNVDGRDDAAVLERVGLTVDQVEDMYRLLAIANYEDRFVIPTAHRELAEDAYELRGACGFTFGNGCEAATPSGLFQIRGLGKRNHSEVM